jgi:hypothetical protein
MNLTKKNYRGIKKWDKKPFKILFSEKMKKEKGKEKAGKGVSNPVYLYRCNTCDIYYEASHFSPSSISRKICRCRKCNRKNYSLWRSSCEERRISNRLYEMERRNHGNPLKRTISIDLVKKILKRFDRRSIISGETEKLSLRRFWPDIPFSSWNCAVVTARENNSLSRIKGNKWREKFPKPFLTDMMRKREIYFSKR